MASDRFGQRRETISTRLGIATLADRKRARVDEIRAGIRALRKELAEYGRVHGGKFWLFGSAASGNVHYDSDVDILVDFNEGQVAAAVDFAERTCAGFHLRPDVSPKSWSTPEFLDRIRPTALILP